MPIGLASTQAPLYWLEAAIATVTFRFLMMEMVMVSMCLNSGLRTSSSDYVVDVAAAAAAGDGGGVHQDGPEKMAADAKALGGRH